MRSGRILIIGNGGTGKSTLSERLGKEYDIPVTHLDLLSWKDNYIRTDENVFKEELLNKMKSERMIIEGWAYHSTMKERLEWSDIIIYLKYPLEYCLKTVFERNSLYNNKSYPFDPFTGDREARYDLYREAVERVHYKYEPEVRNWLKEFEDSEKCIYTFESIDELNENYNLIAQKIHEQLKLSENG